MPRWAWHSYILGLLYQEHFNYTVYGITGQKCMVLGLNHFRHQGQIQVGTVPKRLLLLLLLFAWGKWLVVAHSTKKHHNFTSNLVIMFIFMVKFQTNPVAIFHILNCGERRLELTMSGDTGGVMGRGEGIPSPLPMTPCMPQSILQFQSSLPTI